MEDPITVEMTQPVVDRLQLVQVHHQQAEPATRTGAARDLALQGSEEEPAVEEVGQRVDGGQADRVIAGPTLLAPDDHGHVGEQDHRGEVDSHRGRGRRRHGTFRGPERGRQEVPECRRRRESHRDGRADDERRSADDQGVGEEERAHDAAREDDQERRDRDRHGTLHDELGGSQGTVRQQVVDDQHEQAADGEEGQDGALVDAPQAGHRDDRGRGQQEDPAHDAHDPVVSAGDDLVIVALLVAAANDRGRGHGPTRSHVVRGTSARRRGPPDEGGRDEERHDHEIREHRDDDQRKDRFYRHAAILVGRGCATISDSVLIRPA